MADKRGDYHRAASMAYLGNRLNRISIALLGNRANMGAVRCPSPFFQQTRHNPGVSTFPAFPA